MFNCDKNLRKFHNENVSLTNDQRSEMRYRRDANRNRLKNGLDVPIEEHQSQGSYAMHTMVHDSNNDYDIDDGVIFFQEDLKGSNGTNKPALDARKMVKNAVDDNSFKKSPEVRKNCVRVYYDKGYHVDIPVYRKLYDDTLELASSDWKESDPCAVTNWFNDEVKKQSPDSENGRQLRRIVKLIKSYKNSRDSWKSQMASGFVISALVVECYVSDDRDDISFYKTIRAIHNRLQYDLEVDHPVLDEKLTNGYDDAKTKFLRNKLSQALQNLEILLECNCCKQKAFNAWYKVFQHQYWKNLEENCTGNNSSQETSDNLAKGLGIAAGLAATAGVLYAASKKKQDEEIENYPQIPSTKATKPWAK